ncbi:MAG: ABC transporter permease [Chloroflexi bacterium]|nr:ABC transporter permease [Chloroflexota bacterium]
MPYFGQRLVRLGLVLLLVSGLAFGLGNLAPGDPAEQALRRGGGEPTAEAIAALRERFGLDRPLPLRYLSWLGQALIGDLGTSYRDREPVLRHLLRGLSFTAVLGVTALGVAVGLGVPLGVLAALRRGGLADQAVRLLAVLGFAVPSFWLGLLLILFFALTLRLTPTGGSDGPAHLILPALTLAARPAAGLARLTRATLLETLNRDYVRAARARGLAEPSVVLGHALRNALLPVVTFAGLAFGRMLGGAAIVETVFAWPGLGRLVVEAAFDRDYPVVQGFVLLSGAVFVTLNLSVDLMYRTLDPRVRRTREELGR